jgi:hypothetical protein
MIATSQKKQMFNREFRTKVSCVRAAREIQLEFKGDVAWRIVDKTPSRKLRNFSIIPRTKLTEPLPRYKLDKDK